MHCTGLGHTYSIRRIARRKLWYFVSGLHRRGLPPRAERGVVVGDPEVYQEVGPARLGDWSEAGQAAERMHQPLHVLGKLSGCREERDVASPLPVDGSVGVEQTLEHGMADLGRRD